MKISSLDRNILRKDKLGTVKRNTNKGFSNSFDLAKREHQEQKLKKLLEQIKGAGDKLKNLSSVDGIIEYKRYIREYLSFVLEHYYKVYQSERYHRLLTRVEVINKEVEKLTAALLQQEKANIDIVSKVDEIAGLLLDLYS